MENFLHESVSDWRSPKRGIVFGLGSFEASDIFEMMSWCTLVRSCRILEQEFNKFSTLEIYQYQLAGTIEERIIDLHNRFNESKPATSKGIPRHLFKNVRPFKRS